MEILEEKAVMVPIAENSISLRDDSRRGRIRILYIDGNSMPQIMEKIGMSINTWDSAFYHDRHGIRDFYLQIKKEKMIMDAEKVSKKILAMKAGKKNAKLLAIQQKKAESQPALSQKIFWNPHESVLQQTRSNAHLRR